MGIFALGIEHSHEGRDVGPAKRRSAQMRQHCSIKRPFASKELTGELFYAHYLPSGGEVHPV